MGLKIDVPGFFNVHKDKSYSRWGECDFMPFYT